MRKSEFKEGLGDLAHAAERDHEVQMARADLYKIAKYAIELHDMLKKVSEEQGLEGWQQAKITKAADYIGSVYHNMDYEMKFGSDVAQTLPVPATESSYKDQLSAKLNEATSVCNECGNQMLTAQEKQELADLAEGERHGNSKIYKKCWKGCRKVAGVPRGAPGSCKCD